MAKLKAGAITDKDLATFVADDSDFAFEMQVLAQLRALEFECSHAGTYQDPVTSKIRQFDIRALKRDGAFLLALGIECKNLRPNHPLLLSAVPRIAAEAFHDLVFCDTNPIVTRIRAVNDAVYRVGEMVGKKTDQVGRDANDDLVSDDTTTFDKLNQAVNSCRDLVMDAVNKRPPHDTRVVAPVLIVPQGRLWQVDYGSDGKMAIAPRNVTRSTLFINHTWSVETGHPSRIVDYRMSHLEIVTIDALPSVVSMWFGPSGFRSFKP
jgi:hypothetical protein